MRMIGDCRKGKIDIIITKSIFLFSRNNLDCLFYVRELKKLGIPIIFEKEGINTLQVSSELLITLFSRLSQAESESISKYKGDALLQKTYIVDCISKKSKKNNGELPMYYVENNHPAIIKRSMFDRVQEEISRRNSKKN